MIIKGQFSKKALTVVNVNTSNKRVAKHIMQKLKKIKRKRDKFIRLQEHQYLIDQADKKLVINDLNNIMYQLI